MFMFYVGLVRRSANIKILYIFEKLGAGNNNLNIRFELKQPLSYYSKRRPAAVINGNVCWPWLPRTFFFLNLSKSICLHLSMFCKSSVSMMSLMGRSPTGPMIVSKRMVFMRYRTAWLLLSCSAESSPVTVFFSFFISSMFDFLSASHTSKSALRWPSSIQ